MATPLASFKAKATGPARLRTALRRRVEPLGALLRALDAPRAVRAEVSRGVLGGDIFSVMSARLQGLLQQTGPPEAPPPDFTRRAQADAPRLTRNGADHTDASTPPGVTKPAPPARRAEAKTFDHARSQFPTPAGEAPKPQRAGRATDSALVLRLREYWQSGERAQPPDRVSQTPAASATEGAQGARTLPGVTGAAAPPRRWPEVTGQQLARKLNAAAGAPNSFKRVQQTLHTDSPERVEIQNIFNVEVRADGARGAGFPADLSESIADILREQAIQHGIDLT